MSREGARSREPARRAERAEGRIVVGPGLLEGADSREGRKGGKVGGEGEGSVVRWAMRGCGVGEIVHTFALSYISTPRDDHYADD
jgi:hypothetical protein